MKHFFSSIAFRLLVLLALLSILPFIIVNIVSIQLPLLIVILLVVYGLGAAVIWVMVGAPLRRLVDAAEKTSQGNLDSKVDPGKMQAELQRLANALNASGDKTKTLTAGFEGRILELNQAYSAFKEDEEHFRALFDQANDAIVVHDLESGAILEVNRKFTELYGYKPDEALDLTIEHLSSGIPPYTHRSAVHWIRRAHRSGPQVFEWQAKDKSGHLFWVDLSMRVAVIGGQERLLVSARNITERKRSDQIQIAGYRIFQTGQSSQTLFEFFSLIHEILASLLPARNFMVAFYDPTVDLFTYPYHNDQYETWPSIHRFDNGLVAQVLRSGEPLLLTRETMSVIDAAFSQDVEHPSQDWLGVPLHTARGVIGVLVIRNYDKNIHLGEEEKETFAFISTQIAIAVERKRADDALRESEARWRTLIENSAQLIMTIDRQGRILLINHSMDSLNSEKLQERMIFEFLPGEDLPQKQDTLQKVFSERKALSFEFSFPQPDGKATWFSCNISPVVDQGRVDLAIFNATEITELKQAEAALRESEAIYRQAIEAAGAVPYFFNILTNSFPFIGSGIREITGYSAEEFTINIWESLVQESHILGQAVGLPFQDAVKMARTGNMDIWQCDYQILTRDGQVRWVYDSAVQLTAPDGVVYASIGILQDVTARKRVEQEIQTLNDELERHVAERTAELETANKELEAFSYSISHDLRAPLRAIDGFSRILFDEITSGSPRPEAQRYLKVIRDNAQQMGHLIDDLLSFSRLSRQPLRKVTFPPIEVINQALSTLSAQYEQRLDELTIADLPDCQGDPALLKQVWTNLLSNAFKFTREREQVKIEIGAIIEPGEIVYFVKDNGAGFDMRYADKLFGVFQRLHHIEEYEGTGVGLAIVQRIVRRHDGRVWAEGKLGHGATFFFSLPVE